jgi:CO/xanthine dehydrogenase Mo-binding subunit
MAHSRRDDFDVGSQNATYHVKIGFTKDGMLTAAQGQILANFGTRGGTWAFGAQSMDIFRATKCKNIKDDGQRVFTNTARSASGTDHPFSWHILTTALWRVADALKMDPIEVALKNCHGPESQDDSNPLPSLQLVTEKGKQAIDWANKWHLAGTKKLPNGRMHGIAYRWHDAPRHAHATYSCHLNIKTDGKVYMPVRGPHRGPFCEEAWRFVVAEEVGAKLEDVIVDFDPNASSTAVGGGTDAGGSSTWAAKEAAIDLKQLLLNIAAGSLKLKPEDLDTKDSTVFVKADPTKSYPFSEFVTQLIGKDMAVTYTGKPPNSISFGSGYRKLATMHALFCEVEVDPETGAVDVTNYVVAHDVGKAIRPSSIEGQIEQQVIMTTGLARTEDWIWDKATGVLLNGNDLEYKLTTILDAPAIQPIIVETRSELGCYKATGTYHQVLDRGIIACAVQNAIGKWIDDLPITPDKVLAALGKIPGRV